jgi:predicted dehydrogenase
MNREQFLKTCAAFGTGFLLNPVSSASTVDNSGKLLRIGFVGTGSRGQANIRNLLKIEGLQITAICDINETNLMRAHDFIVNAGQKKPDLYFRSETDFLRLCDRKDLDIVFTATPWEWHTPVCVAAMNAGKHAATEVPAATTLDECWQLVETSERTGQYCTTLANVAYYKNVMTITKMIHEGVFGDILHAEVGYQHDIRPGRFNENTLKYYNETGLAHWRVRHHEKTEGNIYPIHPIGCAAQWMGINRGDRFSYLVSMSTPSKGLNVFAAREFGEDHPLAKKEYVHGDINTTLIKTAKGLTITLYHDCATYRPYDLILRVQGTEGIYSGSHNGIFINGISPQQDRFKYDYENFDEAEFVKNYTPKLWKEMGGKAAGSGHGGGDFMVLHRFIEAIRNRVNPDIDVYDSASWSVITELSSKSVREGSRPVDIPDFTKGAWKHRNMNDSIFVK